MKERITWNTALVAKYMYETDKCKLLSEYRNPATMLEIECECGNTFKRCFRNYRRNNRIGVKNMCKACKTKHLQNVFRYSGTELEEYLYKYSTCSLLKDNKDGTIVLKCNCGNIFTVEFRKFQKTPDGRLRKCPNCIDPKKRNVNTREHAFDDLPKYFEENGINFVKIISGNTIGNSIVEIICPECDLPYSAKTKSIKRGSKRICENCMKKLVLKRSKLNFNKLKTRMEELDYILVSKEDEYENENSDIYFYCKKHIEEGIMSSKWGTLRKSGGCSFCRWEKVNDAKQQTPEGYLKEFNKKCGHILELLSDYKTSTTKIKVKDNRCGTILMMLPWNALNLDFYCPRCGGSRMENRVSLILEDLGKTNYPQHSFEDCVNISKLRFDFVVYKDETEQEIETLIEVQGPQHERPVSFGQRDEEKMMEAFYVGLERDKIKKQYCKDNNIRLLELWYYDYKDFENILRKELEGV